MDGWREMALGDVLTLQRGFDLPARDRIDGPVPIVSSSGITGWHHESKAEPPGVVIGRYGSLGSVHWVTKPYWPLNTALWVKDFKGNDPRYVNYLLRTVQVDGSTASAVPGVNRNHLHRLRVVVPQVQTQTRIASVLGAFDDLIDLNQRRVELLEDVARTLYDEWFVRFRFPGCGRGNFISSKLGLIPSGWRVESLSDASSALIDGDWIETKDQGGDDYRLLQVSNIGVGRFRETGNFRYITAETYDRLRCTAIEIGDVLISRMPDPIGRAWLVDHLPWRAITAVDVAILRPKSRASGIHLSLWLNSPETLAHADAVATGTTRKRVSRSVLGTSRVVVPPNELLDQFAESVGPTFDQRTVLVRAVALLSATRDLLLPRLISGRVDISDIDLGDLLPDGSG